VKAISFILLKLLGECQLETPQYQSCYMTQRKNMLAALIVVQYQIYILVYTMYQSLSNIFKPRILVSLGVFNNVLW